MKEQDKAFQVGSARETLFCVFFFATVGCMISLIFLGMKSIMYSLTDNLVCSCPLSDAIVEMAETGFC